MCYGYLKKFGYPYLLSMDINQIFDLFSSDEERVENTYVNFDEHPYYNIGMFKKLILNNTNYNFNLSLSLQQENPNWDIDDIIDMGENILFNRAYSFIYKLDLNDPTHSETLNTFADTILLKCLVTSIKHYELLEEFEKCAFLLNIKNFVVECI